MVRFLRVLAALVLTAAVAHAQSRDSQVRVDDNTYGVLDAGKLRVTPQGGSQTTLGAALAAAGCTTNCALSNPTITGGSFSGGAVAATTLNVTGTSGVQQNGATILNVSTATKEPNTLGGIFSGASAPSSGQFLTTFGPYGFESLTAATPESAGIGNGNCISQTTAGGSVCIGTSAAASATTQGGFVFIGDDSARDLWGAGVQGGIGIGSGVQGDGSPTGPSFVVGTLSLVGNAGTMIFSGTNTVGDTLTYTISSANACNGTTNIINCTTGTPLVIPYTLVSGDTSSTTLAGHIATALSAPASINYTLGDGANEGSHVLFQYTWTQSDITNHPTEITGHFPANWQTSVTMTCAGTCGEVVTISGPSTGSGNYILGQAMLWPGMVNPTGNAILGSAFTLDAVSPNNTVAVGTQIDPVGVSPAFSVFIGWSTASTCISCNADVFMGAQAGDGPTGVVQTTIVGDHYVAGNDTCITGSPYGNMELGASACVLSPTASWGLSIQNAIWGTNNSGTIATASTGQIGIEEKPTGSYTSVWLGGEVIVGPGSAIATTATAGFLHAPFTSGVPTGTPANPLGDAIQYNQSTHSLNIYDAAAAAWYHIALTSGAN